MSAEIAAAVLNVLERADGPLGTAEVAKAAGFTAGHVRSALQALSAQGQVQRGKLLRGQAAIAAGAMGYRWRLHPKRAAKGAAA